MSSVRVDLIFISSNLKARIDVESLIVIISGVLIVSIVSGIFLASTNLRNKSEKIKIQKYKGEYYNSFNYKKYLCYIFIQTGTMV